MEIWYKIGMLFAILASGLVMGFIPFTLKNINPKLKKRLLSFGNAFAGGVFLSLGFVHLLSEASEQMHAAFEDVAFPLAFVICVVGFIAVFFIEKVLLPGHHHHHTQIEDEHSPLTIPRPKYDGLDVEQGNCQETKMFAYLLTLVLSVHSLISGLALGMADTMSTLLALFTGIMGHKWIEAFALGVALNRASDSLAENWKLIVAYALTEPIGVIIGQILSLYMPPDSLLVTQAFVLSFAGGTFIYVAVMDILPSEFGTENTDDRFKKFGLLLFGLVAISLLMLIFSESHEHVHE